jgi:hypothetical protein
MFFQMPLSNIAWFKLSELISRKEKERALVIHRLLVHSLNDTAYAAQLKGDMFCALHSFERAEEAHKEAAALYEESHRAVQAAFVYETILSYTSQTLLYRYDIINKFALLENEERAAYHTHLLITESLAQKDLRFIEQLCAPDNEQLRSKARQSIRKALRKGLKKLETETDLRMSQYSHEFMKTVEAWL